MVNFSFGAFVKYRASSFEILLSKITIGLKYNPSSKPGIEMLNLLVSKFPDIVFPFEIIFHPCFNSITWLNSKIVPDGKFAI
ncbi:hypothetical protein D3C80_1637430 [compost metagenome]